MSADYGFGRVMVELGITYNINTCGCWGIYQYDVMIGRMVKWAFHGCGPSAPGIYDAGSSSNNPANGTCVRVPDPPLNIDEFRDFSFPVVYSGFFFPPFV